MYAKVEPKPHSDLWYALDHDNHQLNLIREDIFKTRCNIHSLICRVKDTHNTDISGWRFDLLDLDEEMARKEVELCKLAKQIRKLKIEEEKEEGNG